MNARLPELNDLLDGMDVPQQRRIDVHWLARNLGIRNSEHPRFEQAMSLVKQIIREDRATADKNG